MIPIEILDNTTGKVTGQQAFNDNLTVVEQVNRGMLYSLYTIGQRVTNDKYRMDVLINSGKYTQSELADLKAAVDAFAKASNAALKELETAIDAVAKDTTTGSVDITDTTDTTI